MCAGRTVQHHVPLPAPYELVGCVVDAARVLLAFAEGQIPEEAGNESMPMIQSPERQKSVG